MKTDDVDTALIRLGDHSSADEVAATLEQVVLLQQKAREFKRLLDEEIISWIKANGDLRLGDIRYYVGRKKRVKVRNGSEALSAMVVAASGDIGTVADLMAAQPWKHGAVKKQLGDAKFAELFEEIIEDDLKTGKPTEVLKRLDESFVR